ncbi:hypothetical protein H241_4663 [Klebsiella pneumoniae UHKPC29]|nr:hypothetical protein H241_4663 [Klebsiella pneumoniae UHKPC29]
MPAHPVKSKAPPRGINSINSFMIFLAIYRLFFRFILIGLFALIARCNYPQR